MRPWTATGGKPYRTSKDWELHITTEEECCLPVRLGLVIWLNDLVIGQLDLVIRQLGLVIGQLSVVIGQLSVVIRQPLLSVIIYVLWLRFARLCRYRQRQHLEGVNLS